MSRKVITNFRLFDTVDATATQTSVISNIDLMDKASINIKFSAANSGTFDIQVRNGKDRRPDDTTSDWVSLSFGGPATITLETDVQIFLRELCFNEMRVIWEPSSGSGTFTAYLNAKSIGA